MSENDNESFRRLLELIGEKKYGFMRELRPDLPKDEDDPFMPPPLIGKFNLRDGVVIEGDLKPGRKGGMQVGWIDSVMGLPPEEWAQLKDFDQGASVYPDEKLDLITGTDDESMRVLDLVAPLGKGQRALIVSPPRAGKTVLLKDIAAGVTENHPEVELVSLLVDERPEEVTDFRRTTEAQVFASSNDRGEDNHVRVSTLAMEHAKRLVETGKDVVVLLDSLTRLGRTFNLWVDGSGRTLSGGLDAEALKVPRQIFGSARNIEGGGSLTIIATALVDTGSRMDEVIFEEFKGTGNMELVLDREMADRRLYPAIDLILSGTRREEELLPKPMLKRVWVMRKILADMEPIEAMEFLLDKMKDTADNEEFLEMMN